MAIELDELDEARKDEIFALCEIFSDSCTKESDTVITFAILEPEFGGRKIDFQVRFIDSYPRCSKPDFTLTADWLPKELTKEIDDKLEEAWNENLNQPIVFLWLEAIKETVLRWLENESSNCQSLGDKEEDKEEEIDDLNEIEESFDQLNMSKDYRKKGGDSETLLRSNHYEVISFHEFEQLKLFSISDQKESSSQAAESEAFEFHHGEPFVFKKSVFQAHLLRIDDESRVPLARKQLMEYKRVSEATHNIWAYRIFKTLDNRTIEASNYDDDGETQARKNDCNPLLNEQFSNQTKFTVSLAKAEFCFFFSPGRW